MAPVVSRFGICSRGLGKTVTRKFNLLRGGAWSRGKGAKQDLTINDHDRFVVNAPLPGVERRGAVFGVLCTLARPQLQN